MIIRIVARRIRQKIESSIAMQGRGGRAAGHRRNGEGTSRGGRSGRYISSSSPINNNSSTSEIKDTEHVAAGGGMNSRRRRSSNRNNAGRGRSHGNNRNNNAKNQASSAYNNERTVQIIESNFQSIYHNKLCRAAKYKVHAPLCSCPKVVKLRQRYDEEENNSNNYPQNNNNISTVAPSSGGYAENIQFDIDGNISHQLSQLKLDGASLSGSSNPFDNLIVLPDTKGSNPPIYICNNTNLETFQRNATSCELKLAGEIFSINIGKVEDTTSLDNNIPSFKVSCAICLLTSHQRNGFVAIISSSLRDVQSTIQSARDATPETEQRHADHAHFVCAIQLSYLDSLLLAGKTRRSKNEEITKDILSQIRNDDGVTSSLPTTDMKIPSEETALVEIEMGHHLTSLLRLLQTQKSNTKQQYIMVLGYIDSNQSITLDLPGGKRHLGESTIQGFVREVEEECSLCIDYDWAFSFVSKRYGGKLDDDMNDNKARGREEGDNTFIQALEPRKVKGIVSGDAFFMMPPP